MSTVPEWNADIITPEVEGEAEIQANGGLEKDSSGAIGVKVDGTTVTINSDGALQANGGGSSYTFTDGLVESSGVVGIDVYAITAGSAGTFVTDEGKIGVAIDVDTLIMNDEVIEVANPLPACAASDAGKILSVDSSGSAGWANVPTELPAKSASDAGKALVVNSAGNGVEWSSVDGGASIVYIDENTPFADIADAYTQGNLVIYRMNGNFFFQMTELFDWRESFLASSATFIQFDTDSPQMYVRRRRLILPYGGSQYWESVVYCTPPVPSASDAGKVLTVDSYGNGFGWANVPAELPAKSASDAGKVLSVNSAGTGVEWTSVGGGSVSVSAPISGDGTSGDPITLDYDTSCLSLKTTQAGPGTWFSPVTTYSYCGLSSDVKSALSTGTVYFRFVNLISAENMDSPNELTGGYFHYQEACPCLVAYDYEQGLWDANTAIYPWGPSVESNVFDSETGECASWTCSFSNISLDSRLWYLVIAPQPYLSDDWSVHPNMGDTAYVANGDAQIAYQAPASTELTISNPVPSTTASDAGKVLTVNSAGTGVEWASVGGDGVFVLDYSTEINGHAYDAYNSYVAAYNAGKACYASVYNRLLPLTYIYEPTSYMDGSIVFYGVESESQLYYNLFFQKPRASDTATATLTNGRVQQVPASSASDADKVLTVKRQSGTTSYVARWEAPATELPAKSASDAGKALVVNSAGTGVEWTSVGGGSSYTFGVPLYEDNGSVTLKIGTAGLVIAPDPDTGSDVLMVAIDESTIVSSDGALEVANPLPACDASDAGKVLSVDSSGSAGWEASKSLAAGSGISITESSGVVTIAASGGGGGSYSAGNCISLASDTVAWTTSAGITDIVSTAALPVMPVATVLYLIPET